MTTLWIHNPVGQCSTIYCHGTRQWLYDALNKQQ